MYHLSKNCVGIDKSSTTSCHAQGETIIEKTNKTIEEALSEFVRENHNDWVKYVSIFVKVYISSIFAVTKYSPY